MASVIIGDYEYIYGDSYTGGRSARAQVVDKTKTSYGPIQSSITVDGVIYPVKYLYSCFRDCKSMTEAPEIPNGVRSLNYCFSQCYSLEEPPTIPGTVTDMGGCFSGCRGLKTAPILPRSLIRLENCFPGCTSLTQAPIIPINVTHVGSCFSRCQSLRGNVEVYNSPSDRQYIFNRTVNDIFIINKGLRPIWKNIASEYANVHYEAEDNPIPAILDFKVTRVSNNGSIEFDPTGLYAYVQAKLMVYDNLIPVGWTNELKSITLKDNGKVKSVVWQPTIVDYPADVYCWVYLGDTSTHELSLQITDSIKGDDRIERNSRSSDILIQTIPKSYVLIDYYHDETTNTEGMAIGKYAEVADLLDVDIPALFRQNLSAENILLELDTTEPPDTSTTDGQIYQALINLNWTDVIV